jgi:hypothetical protein
MTPASMNTTAATARTLAQTNEPEDIARFPIRDSIAELGGISEALYCRSFVDWVNSAYLAETRDRRGG